MALIIKEFDPHLPIDKIDIAPTNVRISGQTKGLDDLIDSIKKFGLIQPVTVFSKGERYNLIVGQRRLLACKALGWEDIPAFIIRPINEKTQTIVSFGENIHRTRLPYEDSIQACDKLYNQYTGNKKQRIQKISKDLGISPYQVQKYLAHKLIPQDVRKLVNEGKLSEDVAYRITSVHYPNTEKVVEIANHAVRMTGAESQRVIEFSKRNPHASVKEIVEYAKNPPPIIELIIHIEPDTNERIKENAKRKRVSVETYVKDAIERQLEEDVVD